MAGESVEEVSDARDLVSRAVAATDEAFQNLAAGRVPNPLPLRRIVTELLERDLSAEELWRDSADAPPYAMHQVRVAHLSLLVGSALGLPSNVRQDLGVAALYHDCGYAAGESVPFEQHTLAGASLLLRQKGFNEAKTRRVLAVLQHHRDASDASAPGLFGRILRVSEDYDTLARRSGKLSPTMALALMLKWAGTRYDPVLLQLLVNVLGAYPPGTLLQLEDGRVVRSVCSAGGPETFAAPIARLVRLADGSAAPPDFPAVDLKAAGHLKVLRPTS